MIRFQRVSKSFNGRTIFSDVSFEIKAHESVAVLGSSGVGKTTLLRLIAGTIKPDSGAVEVNSRRIGFIFQDHRLLPWKTAEDNVALVLKAAGEEPHKAQEKARSWMNLMKLREFYHYYPRQLSGGMVQRVSIARALAIEPEIMLMDEPFSSLDTSLADSLIRQVRKVLGSYHTTTVYVTHDLVEALSIGQRIFRLSTDGFIELPVTDRQKMLDEHLAGRLKGILEVQ